MDQHDLSSLFVAVAGVKKAWLQCDSTKSDSGALRRHRGFGFVVFHDGKAVDKMLGGHVSRFLTLSDGRKLEIKRSVSSQEMTRGPPWAADAPSEQAQENRAPGRLGLALQSSSSAPPTHPCVSPWLSHAPSLHHASLPMELQQPSPPSQLQKPSPPVMVYQGSWSSGSLLVPPSARTAPMAAMCLVVQPTQPQRQAAGTPCVQLDGLPLSMRQPSTPPFMLPTQACQMSESYKKELEQELLRAMPDHYTD